jgi:MFS family permease
MADTAPTTKYGATMGLYSFALGFGFFVAELSGLLIITAYSYSMKESQQAVAASIQGLFYFSVVLIVLAVLLMVRYFLLGRKKEREAAEAARLLNDRP